MNNSGSIFLSVSALVYTVIITIMFLKKEKINKLENKIFTKLLFITIASILCELLIVVTINNIKVGQIVQKLFLVFIMLWLSRFMDYTFVITVFDKSKSDIDNLKIYKKLHSVFLFINLLMAIFIMGSPINLNKVGNSIYTSGMSVNILFGIAVGYIIVIIFLLFSHIKSIKRNYLPIVVFPILFVICAIIQKIYPGLLLTNSVFGLVIFLMYNTIENPDLKLIAKLKLAKDTAEKAENAKNDFLMSMSHEIRTPMNTLILFTDEVMNEKGLSSEGKEALLNINKASNSILDICSNILNLSLIESGDIEIKNEEYNVKELFNELYDLTKNKIGDKTISYNIVYGEDLIDKLYGDKSKIKIITMNLITNAIKYTDNGEVKVNVNTINDEDKVKLIIRISDTGKGIEEEMIHKIFDKFVREEDVVNSNIEGIGLGLSITKSLVDILGGTIDISSIPNKGSSFTVSLIQKTKNDNSDIIFDKNCKRILIIDNNSTYLDSLKSYFNSKGIYVTQSISGKEALTLVKENDNYDLILMSENMNGLSGSDTLIELKYELKFWNPIIALLEPSLMNEKENYLARGFDDVVSKDSTNDMIFETINKYFKK